MTPRSSSGGCAPALSTRTAGDAGPGRERPCCRNGTDLSPEDGSLSRKFIRPGGRHRSTARRCRAARGWSQWLRREHVARPNRFRRAPGWRLAASTAIYCCAHTPIYCRRARVHPHLLLVRIQLNVGGCPMPPGGRPLAGGEHHAGFNVTSRDAAPGREPAGSSGCPLRAAQSVPSAPPALTSRLSSVDLSVIDRRVRAAAQTDEFAGGRLVQV